MNLLESKTVLPDSNGVQSLTPALPPHLPSNGADLCPTEVKYIIPMIILFLLVLGLVLFILAALNVPSPPRFNLMAGGLAAWILAEIIGHWPVR